MQISYRKARLSDLQLFFNWINDPEVRNNSYNTENISLEAHSNWFTRKISAQDTMLFVAETDTIPAGMVRFDIKEKDTVINILVDKNFRGKGLAAIFLADCCRLYFKEQAKPVVAYIKETNPASMNSFKKAGFHFLRKETVAGNESQIFIKEIKND